jgi:hypothetical protein
MTKIDGRRRARPNRSYSASIHRQVSNNASRYEFAIAGHRLALGELAGTHLECDSAKLVTQPPGSGGLAVELDISRSSRARCGTFIDANPNLEPPGTRKRFHRWAK